MTRGQPPQLSPRMAASPELQQPFQAATWSRIQTWPDASTWRADSAGAQVSFVKLASAARYPRVLDEGAKTRWAGRFLPVAEVLDCGTDGAPTGW